MALSNQMGGGLLSCPDRHILWLSRLTLKRQEKKEHSPLAPFLAWETGRIYLKGLEAG